MNITFKESLPCGSVTAPPSKSYAHRALICAAFSKRGVIKNVSLNEDIKATLSCLKTLGADAKYYDGTVTVGGLNKDNIKDNLILDCNESGSTLRFFIPICLTLRKKIVLKGSKRLLERPLDEYKKLCENNGFLFECTSDAVTLCGDMKSGDYEVSSSVSSQFVSGMLLALSAIEGKSTIRLIGNTESRPYIDMTLDMLNRFGVETDFKENQIEILGRKVTKSIEYTVEGDCTNAAYIEAFKFLNNDIAVDGINPKTIQGDVVYKKMFDGLLNGVRNFDLRDCPDLAPVMFSASCFFGGAKFFGTDRLKYKECDRSLAMKEELSKFGVTVNIGDDIVSVDAKDIHIPEEPLVSHNDHRIVMALSLLCAKYGGTVYGIEAVAKSYPDFFDEISKLKVRYTKDDA